MQVWARNGDHDHPNGRRRVERMPRGDCRVKHPRTAGGREIDQKQFAISSFVKRRGGPVRGVSRDSSWGKENVGSFGKVCEEIELKRRRSQMRRAFDAVL